MIHYERKVQIWTRREFAPNQVYVERVSDGGLGMISTKVV